jgi:4-amino-4-deoxy-L-arabinose transferase-like glycosyltransferase
MITAPTKPDTVISLPQLRTELLTKLDLRNLGIIVAGFVGTLLLIPPVRIYPITDDWIYSQSVSELTHLAYKPHDWTQPIAIGHLAWGAVFAAIFGNTFTVLTAANMVMSIACLLTFYLLLRHLHVNPGPALFGVALLSFNPIYVYISYSFMTDVTFLFYSLAACLLFVRGLEGKGERWLWLGGAATALAYLTRQYGILVIIAALAYMWLSRRWSWRQAIAIAALPVAAVVIYAVWQHFQPSPLIDTQMNLVHNTMFADPLRFLNDRMLRITWLVSSLGLSLAPLVRLPKRAIWAIPAFAVIVYYQFQSLRYTGSTFPESGNIISSTGFLMYAYDPNHNSNQIWNQGVWALLGITGGIAFNLYLLFWIEDIISYMQKKPWRNPGAQDAAFMPLAVAAMTAGTVLVATPFLFDRYWLGVLPMLMIPALRRMSSTSSSTEQIHQNDMTAEPARPQTWRWRWAVLVPIVGFSLLAIRDYKEHATVRWEAAESLTGRGIKSSQIEAGVEWDAWYNFENGAQYIRETGDLTHINYPPGAVMDPVYYVNDLPINGYEQIEAFTYHSWLDAGATKQVLILKRK